MNRLSQNNRRLAVRVVLALGTILLLCLLSWGIVANSLFATMLAGGCLAVDIVIAGSSLLVPDDLRSQATERTLRVASGTLQHMSDGLSTEGCNAVCQLLLAETSAAGIAMTDDHVVMAYVGDDRVIYPVGSANSEATKEVLASGRMQTFTAPFESPEQSRLLPICVIAPLVVSEKNIGTIKFYYRSARDVDRTQLTIARGLAELLSTQLSAYELDRQAELTARAEVKALQAQINPHFLFNTLNTIAALTRTDPARARVLLREFSVFYRRTLESSQSMIALSDELAQTRRYLTIEKARFGEDRIVEFEDVAPGCESIRVPGFIIQPIVENAVRHAMRDDGTPLRIDIQAAVDGDDVMLSVADDGLGMDESVADRLLEGSSQTTNRDGKGAGIALRNVAERISRFYGKGSGVEIFSKEGEGTVVTLRLAGIAPKPAVRSDV